MGFQLPDLPQTIKDPAIKEFIEKYYEISNTGYAHDDYAALFTPDGEFWMNGKKAKGYDEIKSLYRAIWAHVPNRDHKPINIYTHGDDEKHLMVHGDVTYKHHHGHETAADWAALMVLAKDESGYKVAKYHIIVDSAAHV
ncbi:hypothetical protein G7Y79_00017g042890 [Physcia stellaris]|nr:hypothetical protein G7Y79_00017g042890 [Physcia stellaris]